MKNPVLFALFCIINVGMSALIPPVVPGLRRHRLADGSGQEETIVQGLPKSADFASPQDYISDLIWYLLQLTVGAFLTIVRATVIQVTQYILNGQNRLEDVLSQMDETTRAELQAILQNNMVRVAEISGPIVANLSAVLPSLSLAQGEEQSDPSTADPADIIRAILGITLEQLLREIRVILQSCDALLIQTIRGLTNIASRVDPNIAQILQTTSTEMNRARDLIRPVINNLVQIVPNI